MPRRAQHGVRFRAGEMAGFLEAAYQLDTDEHAWLVGVMEASRRMSGLIPDSCSWHARSCSRHVRHRAMMRRSPGAAPDDEFVITPAGLAHRTRGAGRASRLPMRRRQSVPCSASYSTRPQGVS